MKSLNIRMDEGIQNLNILESHNAILEKLVTVGGKAYPNFGNVVIMAGGAGSGKGFIKDKLLGMEGKTFDVDELKKLAMASKKINAKIKKVRGIELSKLSLKKPENVSLLHDIVGREMNLPKKSQYVMYSSIMAAHPDRKPNLIFDVTLKDIEKLGNISRDVVRLGYDMKNIHLIWVCNDVEVAKKQNQERDRVVPEDILVKTHEGAALTINSIMNGSVNIANYMDGDIWFVFSKRGVDSVVQGSQIQPDNNKIFSIQEVATVLVKKAGKTIDKKKVTFSVVNKILSYIPEIDAPTFK